MDSRRHMHVNAQCVLGARGDSPAPLPDCCPATETPGLPETGSRPSRALAEIITCTSRKGSEEGCAGHGQQAELGAQRRRQIFFQSANRRDRWEQKTGRQQALFQARGQAFTKGCHQVHWQDCSQRLSSSADRGHTPISLMEVKNTWNLLTLSLSPVVSPMLSTLPLASRWVNHLTRSLFDNSADDLR